MHLLLGCPHNEGRGALPWSDGALRGEVLFVATALFLVGNCTNLNKTRHAAPSTLPGVLAEVHDETLAAAAPPLGELTQSGESAYAFKTGSPAFNAVTSALGSPALTLPLAAIGGLPLGIQLISQPHTDWDLTGYGNWLQQSIQTVST